MPYLYLWAGLFVIAPPDLKIFDPRIEHPAPIRLVFCVLLVP